MKFVIAALCLSVVLAACGGGGGSSSASQSAVTAQQPAQQTTVTTTTGICTPTYAVVTDGDSTFWGVDVDYTDNVQQAPGVGNGPVGRAHVAPFQLLQNDLNAIFGQCIVTVYDMSIPGARFDSDLNGSAPSVSTLASRLAGLSAQLGIPPSHIIVATNFEINDQYVAKDTTTIVQYYANEWVQNVKSYGYRPMYLEPNPIARADQNYTDPTTGTNSLVPVIDSVFAQNGGYVAPNLSQWENYTTPPNPHPWNVIWLSSDGVHPNDAGYVQKEKNYFPTIQHAVQVMMTGN